MHLFMKCQCGLFPFVIAGPSEEPIRAESAVHPNRPYLAVAQDDGWIGVYDYESDFNLVIYDDITKKDKKSNDKGGVPDRAPRIGDTRDGKPSRKRLITCMEFTPDGELLIALAKGKIEVMSMDAE